MEISCVWAVDGVTDCRNIPIPGSCEAEGILLDDRDSAIPLNTLTFLFDYSSCSSSVTLQQQPEEFVCTDQGTPSAGDFDAQITCTDEAMNVLVDDTFSPGSFIIVQGVEGGNLTQAITCEISEGSNPIQQLRIMTAVFGNFYLQDRYGSFVVESCDAQRCVEPVIYTYSITNIQSESQTITELMRDRDGDIVSLLPLIPEGDLTPGPGEAITVTEEGGLNVCFDADIDTSIMVQTSPEVGPACRGSGNYSVVVEVECRIDLDIMCETELGVECKALDYSRDVCAEPGESLTTLRLRYESRSCGISTPTASCEDFAMPVDRVEITCIDANATSAPVDTVNESGEMDVGEGETIVISSSGSALPDWIECEIRSALDPEVVYQSVTVQTSGSGEIFLTDQFGSLQVEACSTSAKFLDCLSIACFEFIVRNVGTNGADVAELSRTFLDETISLLDILPETFLAPGESTEAIEKVLIDVCRPEPYCITSVVQSSGENGLLCEDVDEYCFGGAKERCEVSLAMTCEVVDEGLEGSCTDLQGEQFPQCRCTECPSELRFIYTALPCASTPTAGLLTCIDENPIPEGSASLVVSSGDTILFSGTVNNGDEIRVNEDGSCLPGELLIAISNPEEASTSSQIVTIDTSCVDPGIPLLANFGAVQFSGYTCADDSVPHNCFVNTLFEVTATNAGQVELNITDFTFVLDGNDNTVSVDFQGNQTLAPGGNVTETASVLVSLCEASVYFATSTVSGNTNECTANADITIGPLEPETISPTVSPVETEAPTVVDSTPPETIPPTFVDSNVPTTPEPVAPTTQAPVTESPTQASGSTDRPTSSDCIFDVQTQCTPPAGSDSCEEINTDPVQCQDKPETMLFLYEGGNCQNSFNAQFGPLFICEDFKGGPSTEPVYVVITDIRGAGIVYFNGWAEVGDLIDIEAQGNAMEGNHNITIYNSNVTVPESIVQTLVLHTSCSEGETSQSLFLKDRFGSMRLVGFNNVAQGNVSCFVEAGLEAIITVPPSVAGQPLTVTTVATRFTSAPDGDESLLNRTTDFQGDQITSDSDPITISSSLDIDLTLRRTYSVFTTVTGVTTDGQQCEGSDLYQFSAGQPPPPLFPTVAPTDSPTLSLQPSSDPERTPCELTAVLTCVVIRGGSNTCAGLQNPSDVTCTGGMMPSALSFQYTGDRCPVNPQNYECTDTDLNMGAARETVFVEVTDGDRIIGFGDAPLNEFVTVKGEYGPTTTVTVYTFDSDVKGDLLQTLTIPTGCSTDEDLTLLNQYGALELTGFTNAASGEQGIEAEIELIYAVENAGIQSAEVESALIIDAFDGGPIEIINNPLLLEPTALSILFRNQQLLNLRLKEQLGRTDTFFLSITGSSTENAIPCTDTAQLSF